MQLPASERHRGYSYANDPRCRSEVGTFAHGPEKVRAAKHPSGQLAGGLGPQRPHRGVLDRRLIAGLRGEHPSHAGDQQNGPADSKRPPIGEMLGQQAHPE